MKANADARKIQKQQRIEEKRLKEEEAIREQDERDRDLQGWSNKMRQQHEVSFHRNSYAEVSPCIPSLGNHAEDADPQATKSGVARSKIRCFACSNEECGFFGS